MWGKIFIKGFGLTGAALAYWLRRFSPRIEILVREDEFDDIYTFKSLRDIIRGGVQEGVLYSRDFLRYVLLVKPMRDEIAAEPDVLVGIREPKIAHCEVSRTCGVEGLLSKISETLVLPSCLFALQLALYLREAGVDAYVSEDNLKGLWLEPYIPGNILTNRPVTRELEGLCQDVQITIEYPATGSVYSIIVPFFDENIHSLAASLARVIVSSGDVKVVTPINISLIERRDAIIVSIGDCLSATSSVKTTIAKDLWVKMCLDKSKNSVLGAQGVVTPVELAELLLSFLESGNLCSEKNLQVLAMTKSSLFKDARVLELLLAAWLKLCS